jgi:hypothetical protein
MYMNEISFVDITQKEWTSLTSKNVLCFRIDKRIEEAGTGCNKFQDWIFKQYLATVLKLVMRMIEMSFAEITQKSWNHYIKMGFT